ncbi:hypothetical protein [Devosia lacusdianchii]|uniref:hypothetical protein n=1 Tax=Devosia lacusdianchii TaxID=2917991 RepID=UPI001F069743|nr:hypothetical protein [Devosia sp. JXJ CY 41]
MRIALAIAALSLSFTPSAFGFDAATQGIIERYKANKLVAMSDVATLMSSSERWCYAEEAGSCGWSDIYLDVTDTGAEFEIGNAWSEAVDIAFTDRGTFKDNRYICETGEDWVPTLRAISRPEGKLLVGRELHALKAEVEATQAADTLDCFDYLYRSSDADAQTITLLQRQYTDDVYNPVNDTEVTLHFDAANAAALTWRW